MDILDKIDNILKEFNDGHVHKEGDTGGYTGPPIDTGFGSHVHKEMNMHGNTGPGIYEEDGNHYHLKINGSRTSYGETI